MSDSSFQDYNDWEREAGGLGYGCEDFFGEEWCRQEYGCMKELHNLKALNLEFAKKRDAGTVN